MLCFAQIPLLCLNIYTFYLRPQRWLQSSRPTSNTTKGLTPYNIQIPDLKPLLDVIVEGCEALDTNLTSIVTQTGDDISTIITNTTAVEMKEIQDVVGNGNTLYVSNLTDLFQATAKTITDLINTITGSEEAETSTLLKEKETALVQAIQALVDSANSQIKNLVDNHTNDEFTGLESLIKTENQTIYTQIQNILADPTNTSPIIPQLKFPDPATIANSIVPGKNQLNDDLVKLVTKLLEQIKAEIQKTEDYELDKEKSIIDAGTTSYVDKLNTIRADILVGVQKITDDVSSTVVTSLLASLAANNLEMKNSIVDLTKKMDQDASAYVIEVTNLEINNLAPLITEYNQEIAKQIIPNLKPTR
ncbi:hypothetical protein THOM_1850 [Trachipleistophora hominis]|uniref:Uncharacterized protein n=1 Tax=Trachipleistophora hominis TaxID=72359 RepID=L7JWX7_TRAHO|nr:hypothetical protein THOM_1850 [Trachipleistophora hominis]